MTFPARARLARFSATLSRKLGRLAGRAARAVRPPVALRSYPSPDGTLRLEILQDPVRDVPMRPAVRWLESRSPGAICPDVEITLASLGSAKAGDTVLFRFSLDAAQIWDPVFATVFSAVLEADDPDRLQKARLGIGANGTLAFQVPFPSERSAYIAGGWRFLEMPPNAFLEVRAILAGAGDALSIRIGDLFAGQRFDPYALNPAFREIAAETGRPDFEDGGSVIAEFERAAAAECEKALYLGHQSFIRPFLVMREGEPRFPMLIGTPNSIGWYALKPHHGIEFHERWGIVGPGEVVLDCGCHAGQMAAYFAEVAGATGRVVAFDPFAPNILQVIAQDRLNPRAAHIEPVQAGVGRAPGLIHVSVQRQRTLEQGGHDDLVAVPIVPLDDYLAVAPTMVKIDVEGAEVNVLLGAQELLRKHRPKLFIEVHPSMIVQFGQSVGEMFRAIPDDLYDVYVMVEGVDHVFRPYRAGADDQVEVPMLVRAYAKGSMPVLPELAAAQGG